MNKTVYILLGAHDDDDDDDGKKGECRKVDDAGMCAHSVKSPRPFHHHQIQMKAIATHTRQLSIPFILRSILAHVTLL